MNGPHNLTAFKLVKFREHFKVSLDGFFYVGESLGSTEKQKIEEEVAIG